MDAWLVGEGSPNFLSDTSGQVFLVSFPLPHCLACRGQELSALPVLQQMTFIVYTFMKLLLPVRLLLGTGGIAVPAPMEHGQVNWHGFNV